MTEMLQLISGGAVPVGFGIVVFLVLLAMQVPKILNTIKGDKIEGNVLDRIERHEKRMDKMDKTIHRQQVRLTRFTVVVVQLIAIINKGGGDVPPELQTEIADLMRDDHGDDE